jgi:hypothetical protein
MHKSSRQIGILFAVFSSTVIVFSLNSSLPVDLDRIEYEYLVLAILSVLAGNVLRAARTRVLLNFGRKGSLRRQFFALSAGALVNAAFPFRLGELYRARLISNQLQISSFFSASCCKVDLQIGQTNTSSKRLSIFFLTL